MPPRHTSTGPPRRPLARSAGRILLALSAGAGVLAACATAVPVEPVVESSPPSTDVVVFDVYPHGDHLHVGSLVRITERDGYDNQPSFLDEDRIVFSSIRGGEASNIIGYSVAGDTLEPVTDTPESEYSPTPVPSGDALSVVRVEMDGVSQHLVRIPLDGGPPERLLPHVDDIGYHAWLDEERVALYRLGEPATLHLANIVTGEVGLVAQDVLPVLRQVPGDPSVSFAQRDADGLVQIRLLEGESGDVVTVTSTPGNTAEHAWLSSATLLSLHDGVVYRYRGGGDVPWDPILEDLREVLGDFTRLATSPSGMRWAVVVGHGSGG